MSYNIEFYISSPSASDIVIPKDTLVYNDVTNNPNATPNNRIPLNRSLDKNTPATKMVNKGVVAFKIDAKPDEMVT